MIKLQEIKTEFIINIIITNMYTFRGFGVLGFWGFGALSKVVKGAKLE